MLKKWVSVLLVFFMVMTLVCVPPVIVSADDVFSVTNEVSNSLPNENWAIKKVITINGVDYYSLTNSMTLRVLSTVSGVITQEIYSQNNDYQLWSIILLDGINNYYSVKNKGNSKYLALNNGRNTVAGTSVQLSNTTSTGETMWQFSWARISDGGTYFICSVWPIFRLQGNGTKTVYVSYSAGDDSNNGLALTTPLKTLEKASEITFGQGDQMLLKSGDVWTGETLTLNGSGVPESPILLSSYGSGDKPIISPNDIDSKCVSGSGVDGWKITNLELCNAKDGIYFNYDETYNHNYLWIENLYIHDLDNTFNSSPYLYNHFSCGISINGYSPDVEQYILSNITTNNIIFDNVNCSWWVGTPFDRCNVDGFTKGANSHISNCNLNNMSVKNGGQWGYSFNFMNTATITNCDTFNTGFTAVPYGAAAIVVAYSQNVVLDGCDIYYAHRNSAQDYDGVGLDFEGGINQHDITYKNATIEHTDGAGIMLFDNGRGAGFGTESVVVDNVKVNYFGENHGSSSAGIIFYDNAGSGRISNCVFNRSITERNYIDGNYSGFTLTGNEYASNISALKIAASSSNVEGYEASKAIDGMTSNYWCADGNTFPAWITVDLGSLYLVTNINQLFNNTDIWKFRIDISKDNENFLTVIDNSGNTENANEFSYDVKRYARFVRLYVLGSSVHWATSKELSIYGVNAVGLVVDFGDYMVKDNIITNILPKQNLTGNDLLTEISFGAETTYKFKKGARILALNESVGTGTVLETSYNGQIKEYRVLIYGDMDGDGDISVKDLAKLKLHLLKISLLDEIYLNAGDVNKTSAVSISDLLLIKKHVLGILQINQT